MANVTSFSHKGTYIWLICAIFFLYEFMLRIVVGTFQHPIMYDLDLSAFQFSIISSTAYLMIYALMQIPVGMILDRIGLKRSLLVGAGFCAFASIGFATTDSYLGAFVFRLLTGFGSSFGFVCLLVSVYEWLPRSRVALMIGVSQFIGTMGPMFAAGPLEVIADGGGISWRSIFYGLGVFGLVLSALIALFVENNQDTSGEYTLLKRPESIIKTLKVLFSNSQALAISVFSALVYFSLEYLSENDGKVFLVAKGLTPAYSAFMITLAWLGYAIGCPLQGWLSDQIKRRRPIMILTSISCTFGLLGVILSSSQLIVAISFMLLGFGTAGQSIGFATIAERFSKPYLAAGLSLNNAIIMFFSAINAPVIGKVLEGMTTTQFPTYSDYQSVFFAIVAVVSLSILISYFIIRETYCKTQAGFTILSRK